MLFSTFYVSPNGEEQHDVVINKIETDKEGGDWATDIVEAINMMCFTMRVHSNLVGSVPGKSQTNNSGSDKRELYTITLKKYVPNTLKAVAGELSLFDKIQYHLLQAEQWLTATFVSSDTMSRIRTYSDSTPLLHYCRIITAAEAMLHAVPQLDLILTPNGFGIVSNQNVIPASKERIERLLLSLEKQRDDALAVILTLLPDAHHWTASEQFNYFAATMFPTLDIVHQLGFADHIWLRYQDTRAKLLAIEHRLETEFFSPELMDMLRTANALNKWDMTLNTAQYKRMYQRISAIEFSILRIGEYPIPSIIDIVNSIRLAKGNVFAEWKNSETAKLFEDHGYKNKKQSGGYFF